MCQAVYFLRHGATAEVPSCLKGQRIDPPLSSEGHRQAQRWAEKLSAIPFQAVVYTLLQRARETAAYFLSGRAAGFGAAALYGAFVGGMGGASSGGGGAPS